MAVFVALFVTKKMIPPITLATAPAYITLIAFRTGAGGAGRSIQDICSVSG